MTLPNLAEVKFSTPTQDPTARVKKPAAEPLISALLEREPQRRNAPLMLLRIVVLLTLVYPSAAFIDQFAENLYETSISSCPSQPFRTTHQSPQKTNASAAVWFVVKGGSVQTTESGRAPRVRDIDRECERARKENCKEEDQPVSLVRASRKANLGSNVRHAVLIGVRPHRQIPTASKPRLAPTRLHKVPSRTSPAHHCSSPPRCFRTPPIQPPLPVAAEGACTPVERDRE